MNTAKNSTPFSYKISPLVSSRLRSQKNFLD